MPWVYRDRTHAGEVLASHLTADAAPGPVTVLALPRGGVPVAFPVARAFHAPLDILAVRKLGVPGHEELAMGAVAAGGDGRAPIGQNGGKPQGRLRALGLP